MYHFYVVINKLKPKNWNIIILNIKTLELSLISAVEKLKKKCNEYLHQSWVAALHQQNHIIHSFNLHSYNYVGIN